MIRRSEGDKWFSKCVRMRARWKCEVCEKQYDESSMGLHCSHHFGRRHKATRTEPLNCIAACYACHRKLEEDPLFHVDFFKKHIGEDVYEILAEKHRMILPKREYDERMISKHFREQFKQQQKKAAEGVQGRLDFIGYI